MCFWRMNKNGGKTVCAWIIWRYKFYQFIIANICFTTPFTCCCKTNCGKVEWYNLCLQIIQPQTCYPLTAKNFLLCENLQFVIITLNVQMLKFSHEEIFTITLVFMKFPPHQSNPLLTWTLMREPTTLALQKLNSWEMSDRHFYAPGLKGPPGASSNWIVCPSVRLFVRPSVCLSVIPSRLQIKWNI